MADNPAGVIQPLAAPDGEEQPVFLRPNDEKIWRDLQQSTRNAAQEQKVLLKRILESNGNTEYLRRMGLEGRSDEESFKAHVPVITYEDIEADIQRIADGDASPILCVDRITQLTMSSGTSGGKSKLIPGNFETLSSTMRMFQRSASIRNMVFPVAQAAKNLVFSSAGKVFVTKGGLRAGTGTTVYLRSDAYKNRPRGNKDQLIESSVTPDEVVLGYNTRESMYCHLLCGLKKREEVMYVGSTFAYGLTEAFRMLEQSWEGLVEDLRSGSVSREMVVDPEIRAAMDELLDGPDEELAKRVEEECGRGWEGIVARLWPNALYVIGICTGAMKPYVPVLQKYLGPGLPLVCGDYGASECWVSSNLNPRNPPEDTVFTLAPDVAYMEFIPLAKSEEGPGNEDLHVASTANYLEGQPVGMQDVKIGQMYELVLTTMGGLYRYRMGDVLKVVSFYNQAPKVEFVCRKNVVLSVNTDKTDEVELMAVVAKAAKLLEEAAGLELVDFTSHADMTSRPGNYVIYWEVKKGQKALPFQLLQKCCTTLDQSFNNPYMRGRVAKTIGPLKLRIVNEGTFSKLSDFALGNGGGGSQYKTPRCVTSPKILAILDTQLVQEVQSPDFPDDLLAAWKPLP